MTSMPPCLQKSNNWHAFECSHISLLKGNQNFQQNLEFDFDERSIYKVHLLLHLMVPLHSGKERFLGYIKEKKPEQTVWENADIKHHNFESMESFHVTWLHEMHKT